MDIVVNKTGDIQAVVMLPNIDVPSASTYFRYDGASWSNIGAVQFDPVGADAFVNAVYITCEVASALLTIQEPISLLKGESLRFEAGHLAFQVT